jgi:anaerobic selenocysteine-containing dehydrogenase
MMVGSNPAVSHSFYLLPFANPLKSLREAREAGLKLIVVDPRETETAREADIHVRVRPGEDATLFAGLIHIVLDCGLHDREFCERFVGPLDALRSAVAPFTPEYVFERTGVPVDTLFETATVFATAARKSAASGTGPNMAADSNLAEHLIEAFNAICGGYRRAGEKAWNTGGLYARGPGVATVQPPTRPWEHGPKCKTADVGPMFGEFPVALLPSEILHPGDDRIRALIVVGGDLARALPESERVIAALEGLELLVTLDMRPTDTGGRAHYEIATSLPYERHDLTGAIETYFSKTFAQVAVPVLERPPGIIDDWEFFWGLARRAGTPMRMKQVHRSLHQNDIPGDGLELDPGSPIATEDIVRWMSGLGHLDYATLRANPHGIAPEDDTVIPAVPDDGARLDLCPPDVVAEIALLRERRPDLDQFPLRLISRRMRGAMNSAFRKAGMVTRHTPFNPVYLSTVDMVALGLGDEAAVRIESRSGSVLAYARADDSLAAGSVAMTHAWGPLTGDADEPGANVNQLTSLTTGLQPINYMPLLSAIPVRITAVEPA